MLSNNYRIDRNKKYWSQLRIKIYLYVASVIVMLLAGWYFFSKAGLFQIKTIKISGLALISKEEFTNELKTSVLTSRFKGMLGFANYWSWPNELSLNNPAIKTAKLKKNLWKKTISIHVDERNRYGIWCNDSYCAWFDDEGQFFDRAPTTDGYLLYKITGDYPERGLENILKILKVLEDKNIGAQKITYNKKLEELEITTPENTEIIFTTRKDSIATFLTAYESIIKKIGLDSIRYIDLTVENRIYYK